jgi:Tfp pilus assembly protein PilE
MNRRGFTLTELIVCVWIAFCGTLSLVTIIGMLYLGYLLVMALTKYISS